MQESAQSRRAVKFGAFEADLAARELRKNGAKVRLQDQPFQVLALLLENPGRVVTREELRQKLWSADTFVDFDNGLNTCINKIREALGDTAEKPRFVETLPRRGYRFIGAQPTVAGGAAKHIESLVVLPLENLSGDPEQEYFADGMTEALITMLAKIGPLRVISRTSAMRFKKTNKGLPEIARELNVDAVVEGTVLRVGDRVRISAQLIDARTDGHLWAENYERAIRDVLALQVEVARAIANEIRVKLTPHEQEQLKSCRQIDPEAYEHYLKGRFYLNKRTLEGLRRGVEYFESAVEKEPQYAAAQAGLADCASRLGFYGYVSPEEGCARAKDAALRTIALDRSCSDAHAALGFSLLHYDCSFLAAEAESRRAVELDPQSPWAALALGCCLVTTGRFDEGSNEAMRLIQVDPVSLSRWAAGGLLYHSRRFDQAIAQARKCLEIDPVYAQARWTIAMSAAEQQTADKGIQELEQTVRATGENQYFLGSLGYCYAKAGRKADAMQAVNRLRQLAKDRYVSGYWLAVICGVLGDKDEAFTLLEAAYREHAAWMAYVKVAPFFDDLRTDLRFDTLVRRMNFPP
jgi:TolB-like protein/Flp pilus assembly protein TadD